MKVKELVEISKEKISVDLSNIDNLIIDKDCINVLDMEIESILTGYVDVYETGLIVIPKIPEPESR